MGFELVISTDIRHRFGASGIRYIQIQTKYSSRALRVYEDASAENAHVAEQPLSHEDESGWGNDINCDSGHHAGSA